MLDAVYLLYAAPLECNSQSDAATTTTSDRRVHNTRRTSQPQLSPATTVSVLSRVGISVYTYILPLMYSLALRFVSTCARPSLRIRIPSISLSTVVPSISLSTVVLSISLSTVVPSI